MDRLNSLTSVINGCRRLSTKIVADALPILEKLRETDNDLVADVLDERTDVTAFQALNALQEVVIEMIKDGETVQKEIGDFSEAVIQGDEVLTSKSSRYPFLAQVWYGDIYDDSDVKAFQMLYNELSVQSAEITEDNIVSIAVSRLG